MRLETIAIHLRRRSAWEALDLGHAMLRNWAPRLYRAWFASYWLAGIVILLLMWPWPEYSMLVLWWLKPLFDRVLLLVCSRAAFGDETSVREVWRHLPQLWWRGPGILSALTVRRLSLSRSFLLPVWQLEEQRGTEARARLKLLSRRCRGHAVWVTFFCANMSTILLFSLLILLALLVPGDGELQLLGEWFAADATPDQHVFGSLLYMLAETVVEPLYVASGFSLYLNRRSELEAWDVELGLRRLAERRSASVAAATLTALVASALLVGLPMPAPAYANEAPVAVCPPGADCADAAAPSVDPAANGDDEAAEEDEPADAADASVSGERRPSNRPASIAIQAVLADPVFGQVKDDWHWRWRRQAKDDSAGWGDWLASLRRAFEFVAELVRGMLWIVGGLALAAIVLVALRYRHLFVGAAAGRRVAPDFLFGLDLRPESLPSDILAAARAALIDGRTVDALSLLYRGALLALIAERQIEFHPGDTENDCLQRISGRVPEAVGRCFGEVVEAWRLAAYGRLPVAAGRVESLVSNWQACFGKGEARA